MPLCIAFWVGIFNQANFAAVKGSKSTKCKYASRSSGFMRIKYPVQRNISHTKSFFVTRTQTCECTRGRHCGPVFQHERRERGAVSLYRCTIHPERLSEFVCRCVFVPLLCVCVAFSHPLIRACWLSSNQTASSS